MTEKQAADLEVDIYGSSQGGNNPPPFARLAGAAISQSIAEAAARSHTRVV
jgi:hypothetical protein